MIAGRDFTEAGLVEHRPVAAASGPRIRETAERSSESSATSTTLGVREPAPSIVYWPTLMEQFYGNRMNVQRAVTFAIRSDRTAARAC